MCTAARVRTTCPRTSRPPSWARASRSLSQTVRARIHTDRHECCAHLSVVRAARAGHVAGRVALRAPRRRRRASHCRDSTGASCNHVSHAALPSIIACTALRLSSAFFGSSLRLHTHHTTLRRVPRCCIRRQTRTAPRRRLVRWLNAGRLSATYAWIPVARYPSLRAYCRARPDIRRSDIRASAWSAWSPKHRTDRCTVIAWVRRSGVT